MRLILILLMVALFGMVLSAATAPEPARGIEPVQECICSTRLEGLDGRITCPSCGKDWGKVYIPDGGWLKIIPSPVDPQALQPLDRHNEQMRDMILPEWAATEIACPKCGKALERNTRFVLTSYPCQYPTRCPACGYTGTCN